MEEEKDMTQAIVSVGVPVYNEKKYIAERLLSIREQSYPFLEVIISDNSSTDGTWDIIQEFAKKDSRFIAVRQSENIGAADNFSYVLDQAAGKYFIWAGAHDLWDTRMIEECVKEIEKNENLVLCVPQTKWIDAEGELINSPVEKVDTRLAASPSGRALAMYKQMNRCNAVYGLHRRESLLRSMPWPNLVNNDFIGLMRIAAGGDILSINSTSWFRRQNRIESRENKTKRHIEVLRVTGLSARYPYIASRVYTIREFTKLKGRLGERLSLLSYSLWQLFLQPLQFKILVIELFDGIFSRKRRNKTYEDSAIH